MNDNKALKILFGICITIMLAPIFLAALLTSCEKDDVVIIQEEAIDTTIYDSRLDLSGWLQRDVVDTMFDLVIIGADYKGNAGLNLFLTDVNNVRPVINYIESFSGDSIRVTVRNVKQNLQCRDNLIGNNNVQTIGCDELKIIDFVNHVAEGIFYVDAVAVLVNGKGHGSHSGSKIFIIGTGSHASVPTCPFYEGLRKKFGHEFGHLFGLSHENTTLHFMNDGVNGGCAAGDTYTLWQQQIIINYIDSVITN